MVNSVPPPIPTALPETDAPDILVISDLHLGGSLGPAHKLGASPGPKPEETLAMEQALCGFLEHHRTEGPRYRLVINGDMIDLVGVTLMPSEVRLAEEVHPDDHTYGLGARAQAAMLKLERVLEYHEEVFAALGRFVASGHSLVLVIGNHDIELHFPEVQRRLVDHIVSLAALEGDREGVKARISLCDWFFFEEGLAWIEHGHQYDPYCSFEDVLAPATDEREIDPNVGTLLLRYVQAQFAEEVHHAWGKSYFGYLHLWFRQGRERITGIGRGYIDVIRRLFAHWSARLPERILARKARAKERMQRLAQRARLEEERLFELMSLGLPPITVDRWRIVQALMLDRLLLMLLGPFLLATPLLLIPWSWMPHAFAAAAVPLGLWGWVASMAREPVDPSPFMRERARKIRALARVPIVIMGHSHLPEAERDATGLYFNTGAWAEPALGFTHVRISRTKGGVKALLCRWRDGVGSAAEALAIEPKRV